MKKLFCHNIKILYYEHSCINHREASNETLKMILKICNVTRHKGAQPAVKVLLQDIPGWFKVQHKKNQTK
jgi:hypothetical protein